jgi:spore cortex formation protein SpoVR/YcgB (stage V sporulation)
MLLDESDTKMVLQNLANLWGYEVRLRELNAADRKEIKTHIRQPQLQA